MNILVTGANGQLGNEMRIVTKGSKDKYIFTDVCDEHPESIEMLHKLAGDDLDITTTKLDITNLDAIREMVRENDVKVIVNCAAWTNVDGAEDSEKYDIVEKLNAKAPENLAIAMKEVGGLLVHISTDYVFGGDPYNTPCKEDQKGTPTGVYGTTKLLGEQKIIATECKYMILRTAWLYSEFGKNFVKTMLNLTETKPQLKVVFDQTGTPTYAWDLANAIVAALKSPVEGIYHYSNEGVCSWYDFTKMIAEYAGNTGCDIQPCHSDEFPSPVKRPAYSVLDKTMIKETFGIKVPYWTDSLRKCLSNICILMLLLGVALPVLANEVTYTGTVPCVFVNTENGAPIESKTEYINATMNIETFGFEGYEDAGTKELPLSIQIRGRGNWTWRSFDKKPYKIKLVEGAELLGMNKNKHWALLSHPDDPTGFYRNTLGFEVSRMLGMKFTAEQRPVELVLNGEYLGLYMLTETIRVGKRRLDIEAEDELMEEPDKVGQGGWLVEFDNYDDENQISIDVSDTYLKKFLITYHTPEKLSDIQKDWLISQFQSIKDAIFVSDSTSTEWESYIDVDALARYCMMAEITTHQEAFVGSCFLYKESGEKKWKFGPVWDFGSSLWEYYRGFMWEDNYFGKTIMTEMSKFYNLQNKLREIWPEFYVNAYPHLDEFIEHFADQISDAVKNDALRWPQYGHGNASYNCEYAKTCIRSRIEWLNKQWEDRTTNVQKSMNPYSNNKYSYTINGYRILNENTGPQKGIYIKQGKKYVQK